jgi:hypothetical protein
MAAAVKTYIAKTPTRVRIRRPRAAPALETGPHADDVPAVPLSLSRQPSRVPAAVTTGSRRQP